MTEVFPYSSVTVNFSLVIVTGVEAPGMDIDALLFGVIDISAVVFFNSNE